jgi:hypothetical protein
MENIPAKRNRLIKMQLLHYKITGAKRVKGDLLYFGQEHRLPN